MPDLYLTRAELRDRRIVGNVLLGKQHNRGKANRDDRTCRLHRNSVHLVKVERIAEGGKGAAARDLFRSPMAHTSNHPRPVPNTR